MNTIFISIVTFNSEKYIEKCLNAIFAAESTLKNQIIVQVSDNSSEDSTVKIVEEKFTGLVKLVANRENLGFCAAHNQAVAVFLKTDAQYLLVLNPDLRLRPDTVSKLIEALSNLSDAGIATPKIYRADDTLEAVVPLCLDAAGMELTPSLRHLDRGSNQLDEGQYNQNQIIFGGTGACLFFKREAVMQLLLDSGELEKDLERVHPQLLAGLADRKLLFDEGFFAYREDADLAWRAKILGISTLYVADAVAYHKRVVLADNRRTLSPYLNRLSVRNRFLLQINNFSFVNDLDKLLPGFLWRNLLVVFGVFLTEWSSIPAFLDLIKLFRRAYARRRILFKRARELSAGTVSASSLSGSITNSRF